MAKVIVIGAGTMGGPLVNRLLNDKHNVAAVVTRKRHVSPAPWIQAPDAPLDPAFGEHVIAGVLDQHVNDVEVAFLAIPSDGVGRVEKDYIKYFTARGIYVVTFAKSALAYHYDALCNDLDLIGRSATVGSWTMIVPWLKSHQLVGKTFTAYAYINASSNFFGDETSDGDSPEEAFRSAQNNRLAEPGSSDYVEFLNGEIGGDMPQKIPILMKDAVLPEGVQMTPSIFKYKTLDEEDVSKLTLPTGNYRYVICISNKHTAPMFEPNRSGRLYGKVHGFTISGGFYDISRNTDLSRWFKGGKANGVKIRFEGKNSESGTVEIAGPGAGLATIGAAMNDMNDFLKHRTLGQALARLPHRHVPEIGAREKAGAE